MFGTDGRDRRLPRRMPGTGRRLSRRMARGSSSACAQWPPQGTGFEEVCVQHQAALAASFVVCQAAIC